LALLGVLAAAAHFTAEPYNPGFVEHPVITKLHVVLGGLYLAVAPFQFSRRVRSRAIGYHRAAGRALVAAGVLVGLSALFLGLVVPFSGDPERVVIGLFGGYFLVCLITGFVRVRQGRISEHREWMMRAFAVALSIATMRLIFIPALLILGEPTDQQAAFWSVASFAMAFTVHATTAEMVIWSGRRAARPSLHRYGAVLQRRPTVR
jgi:uncharacterized membrane protein